MGFPANVFGTVRSRFDALAYNNETVKAETSFEISAFDKDGKMIMRPPLPTAKPNTESIT